MKHSPRSQLLKKLEGGDLRSIGRADAVVRQVLARPALLAQLVQGLLADDPRVRMRSADALEKVSATRPELVQPFKGALLGPASRVAQQEVRWHLAQIYPRLELSGEEAKRVMKTLRLYLGDESAIVKTFSMQAMTDLALVRPGLKPGVRKTVAALTRTGTPAMRTRGKKLLVALA